MEEEVIEIIGKIAEKRSKDFAAGLVAGINLTTPDKEDSEEKEE